MDRPHGSSDEDKHNIAGGDQGQLYPEEQQHEKKSVFRKVKDKARKLRDNITNKHGHGHDSQAPPSEEFEGYEDEDEKMDEDPEIDAAPIYDSHQSATSQGSLPRTSQAEGTTFSTSQPTAEERLYAPKTTPVAGGIPHAEGGLGHPTNDSTGVPEAESGSFIPGQVGVTQHDEGLTFGGSQTPHSSVIVTPTEQQHHHSPGALPGYGAPQDHIFVMNNRTPHPSPMAGVGETEADYDRTSNLNQAQEPSSLEAALEKPHSLEENPRGPGRVHEPENYQSKVTDPTGMGVGETEADYDRTSNLNQAQEPSSLEAALEKPHSLEENPRGPGRVHEPENYQSKVIDPTGMDVGETEADYDRTSNLNQAQEPSSLEAALEKPHSLEENPRGPGRVHEPENYQSKVIDPTGMGVGETEADYDRTSNLNQAQEPSSLEAALEKPHSLEENPRGPGRVHEPENYQSKVTDPTGMGGEEIGVTGAAPVQQALNKMNIYDEPTSEHQVPRQTKGAGQQQESLFKPEQHGQGHQALHTGSHNQFLPESPISAETTGPEHKGPHSTDATEHDQVPETGSKQGSTYMDQVSSATSVIVDKAAQAKNAVASKLGYGYGYEGGYDQTADTTTNPREAAVGEGEKESHKNQEGAKLEAPADGGVSVKEYLVEKISPGEEDKALSEVITGAFPLHNSNEDRQAEVEDAQKVDPEGKVTLSPTVASRLGGGADEKHSGSTTDTSGTGVFDRIKEAATGWFGKGGETQPLSTASHDTSHKESDRTEGIASGETGTVEQQGRQ